MGAAAIAAIAIPFAQEIILAWMKAQGKTSITVAELETISPDEILQQMGIKLHDS